MKILRCCIKIPPHPGGMEKHIRFLTDNQRLLGDDVDLMFNSGVALLPNDRQIIPIISLYKLKPQFLGNIFFCFFCAIELFIKNKKYDVIHFHGDWSILILSGIIKKICAAEIVVFSVHGEIAKNKVKFFLMKYFSRNTDVIFSTGYSSFFKLKTMHPCKKIYFRPSGVSSIFFEKASSDFRDKSGDVVITVARLVWQKNLRLFLDIAKEMPDKFFHIVGDGPEKINLMNYQNDLKINNIVWWGNKNAKELTDLLISADCFLLTSIEEGTPTSILEAMALGLPIISSNVGGISSIIKDELNGFVINSYCPVDYAKKIYAIMNNKEMAKKISNFNLVASMNYGWSNVASIISNLTCQGLKNK